jgi:L-fuconolactonase
MTNELRICDAQVHAPDVPSSSRTQGIAFDKLLAEMDAAGVERVVVVPLSGAGGDSNAHVNDAALEFARQHPDRIGVMGLPPLTPSEQTFARIDGWLDTPGMLGARISFVRDPARSLLLSGGLDWLWERAQAAGIPIMMNIPELAEPIGDVAERFGGLKIIIDHAGLVPFVHYAPEELLTALKPVLALARHANVSVKASALPTSVTEPFPFPSLHEPVRRLVDAFGPSRTFWGSDLTRLQCTYSECVRLFTEELDFLSDDDKELIMGRALCERLAWPL